MKREYGIDLLKMMAMIMVVTHHILNTGVETKVLESLGGGALCTFIMQMFHVFCYCAVDVFVMATGYIMCRLGFKYVRIVRLWRQVVGYSLVLCLIGYFAGLKIGWRDWSNSIMPITTNQYWFFTQYFALFFMIPFLNRLIDSLTERETWGLLATGLGLLSLMPIIAGRDLFVTKWGYCCLWFMYLYCIGAAIRKLDIVNQVKARYAILGLLLGCGISACGAVAGEFLPGLIGGGGRLGDFAYSYTSPSLVLEALALFVLLAKLHFREECVFSRFIVFCAPSTFIVYVVHSNGVFRRIIEWDAIFLPLSDYGILVAVIGSLLCAVAIFCMIVLVDSLRRIGWKYIERQFNGSN